MNQFENSHISHHLTISHHLKSGHSRPVAMESRQVGAQPVSAGTDGTAARAVTLGGVAGDLRILRAWLRRMRCGSSWALPKLKSWMKLDEVG